MIKYISDIHTCCGYPIT